MKAFKQKMKEKAERLKAERAEQARLEEAVRVEAHWQANWGNEALKLKEEQDQEIFLEQEKRRAEEWKQYSQERLLREQQAEQARQENADTGLGVGHERTWQLSWETFSIHPKIINLPMSEKVRLFKIAQQQQVDQLNYYANMFSDNQRTVIGNSEPSGLVNNSSLTFVGGNNTGTYVDTDFNPDTYNLNLGFTVSYWVRPDEVGTNMFAFGRKDTSQGASKNHRFVFGISKPNKIHIGVGGNKMTGTWGGNLIGNPSGLTPAELFPDLFTQPATALSELIPGTWIHFAVTYEDRDSAGVKVARKVYLNGELIQEALIDWTNIGGTTGGMYFGGRNINDAYQFGWDCGLDEVAIFDTEKDASWVTSAYNSGTPTDLQNESGLVGYWRFEEGTGTNVEDLSGNGNDGTLTATNVGLGLPTWSTDVPK